MTPSRAQANGFRLRDLSRRRVLISRTEVLRDAESLLQSDVWQSSAIEVQFVGERGFGTGVTAEFYTKLGTALMEATAPRDNACPWIWDKTSATPPPFGLFPRPLHPSATPMQRERTRQLFTFLGRLIATCLRDDQLLPFPFSRLMLDLSTGTTLNRRSAAKEM